MKKLFITLAISLISVISVSAQTDFETILLQFHADSLKKTVEDLVGFDNRLCCPLENNNKKVAQYLVQRLKDYGLESAAIDSFHVTMWHFLLKDIDQYMYNVKARLSGSDKPDSIVIIGAHLDAIAYDANYTIQNMVPGANDNATGVAVMIEIARIFHANNLIPKYSIDFMAYDAEEIGLCGSQYDTIYRKSNNENIYVMLNNDMVGMQSEEANEWKVVFHADPEAEDIQNKAITICHNYTLLHPYIPDNTDSSYRNSDSWSYRLAGFKTFYTHEYEDDPYYHSIFDLPQRLNYHYMAEIAKLHFSLLYDFTIEHIALSTVGLNEPPLTPAFNIYPNPTSNILRIVSYPQNASISKISIYDYMGREVLQNENIDCYPYNIDVSKLQSGVYIVKIVDADNLHVMRFLKR